MSWLTASWSCRDRLQSCAGTGTSSRPVISVPHPWTNSSTPQPHKQSPIYSYGFWFLDRYVRTEPKVLIARPKPPSPTCSLRQPVPTNHFPLGGRISVINPPTVSTSLESDARVLDASSQDLVLSAPWMPIKVSGADIAATIDRLTAAPSPVDGRRVAYLVHPESTARSFAPGIEVSVEVLLPGERTNPLRSNSSLVQICIEGRGSVVVDDTTIDLAKARRVQRAADEAAPLCEPRGGPGGSAWRTPTHRCWPSSAPTTKSQSRTTGSPPRQLMAPSTWTSLPRLSAERLRTSRSRKRVRAYEDVNFSSISSRPPTARCTGHTRSCRKPCPSGQATGNAPSLALYNPATERKQGATGSFPGPCQRDSETDGARAGSGSCKPSDPRRH